MSEIELVTNGFNAGYLMQQFEPELAQKLLENLKGQEVPYAQGFVSGVEQYQEEVKELEMTKASDRSLNRDKGFDR